MQRYTTDTMKYSAYQSMFSVLSNTSVYSAKILEKTVLNEHLICVFAVAFVCLQVYVT